MSYRIEFARSAEKELARLHPGARFAVAAAVDGLASDPRPAGTKALKGPLRGLWRLRVGNYRVIYAIDDTIRVVEVAKVGPRGRVYR